MFSKEVYLQRRNRLCDEVGSGLIVLPGNSESPFNYPSNTYPFRQDSNFLYFVGIDQEDMLAVIDADSRDAILYGDELTMDDIIWTGPKESLSEIALKSGIDKVMPKSGIFGAIKKALAEKRKVHFLPPYRAENIILLSSILGVSINEIKHLASEKLIRSVIKLRSVKGQEEIEELEEAASIGYDMHYAVMKGAIPGNSERELAAKAESIALSRGAGISFPTILSQRGEVLHGHEHTRILEKGRLLLCDAGAESLGHYASDFTRTVPVGGHFNQQQKDLYQIVLDANNKAFELIRPGIPYRDVHIDCCLVMAEGLKSLGILKGDMKEAVAEGAHALFMVHGLGHMIGLDVHDMEDLGEDLVGYDNEIKRSSQFGFSSLRLGKRLEPGYVMSVEPGLYFIPALIEKWKSEKHLADFVNYDMAEKYVGIGGIRIEDDALVTENGCRMPGSKRLPVTPEEIATLF